MLLLQGIWKKHLLSPNTFLVESNFLIKCDRDKDYIKTIIFKKLARNIGFHSLKHEAIS